MKMYKIDTILELLNFEKEENYNNYVGFATNEAGNLVMIVKENEPDFPEAVSEIELLESEGEY